jgi:hypothetical protein
MKRTLQFHADRRELTAWIGAWVRELRSYVVLHPLGANLPVVVPHRADDDGLVLPDGIRQVSLSRCPLGL